MWPAGAPSIACARRGRPGDRVGAGERDGEVAELGHDPAAEQLADRALGPGHLALRRGGERAHRQELLDAGLGVEVGELLAHARVAVDAALAAPSVMSLVHGAAPAATAARADRDALVHQRGDRDRPTFVDVAEHLLVRHADVVEEHLVEAGAAVHLLERLDRDAGRPHVDDERGDALVLLGVGVRAADDLAEVGELRARRPDLLAVDDPLVAVARRGRGERRDVGAGAGLAEQLRPDLLAAQQLGEVALLLRGGADRAQRRRDHAEADDERLVRHREAAPLLGRR